MTEHSFGRWLHTFAPERPLWGQAPRGTFSVSLSTISALPGGLRAGTANCECKEHVSASQQEREGCVKAAADREGESSAETR